MTDEVSASSPIRVVALGEALWDVLPDGPRLGGAPVNVACHIRSLGGEAAVLSRVGEDELGQRIARELTERGLSSDLLQTDPRRPTGTVSVEVDEDGKPTYTIHADVAWDAIETWDVARQRIRESNAICFGTLAQRSDASRDAIQTLVDSAPETVLRVLDVNLRQSFYSRDILERSFALADVVKISDEELPVVAELFGLLGSDRELVAKLADASRLRAVALTRGPNGSLLWAGGEFSEHEGVPSSVVDTIGAGDSFTAAWILGQVQGRSLDEINKHANRVAAYVCSRSGATPSLPEELKLDEAS
jgi:fructokinase